MQRSNMLRGIGYGAAAFLGAVTVTTTNALAADVPAMSGERMAVNADTLKLLPAVFVGKTTEKLQGLPSSSLTTLVQGGRLADSTPITQFASSPTTLTPAASKLTKGDLLALSSGRLNAVTSSLTVGDIASIKGAFRQGSILRPGVSSADGISSCCCTPCCTAATNDLSTFARA